MQTKAELQATVHSLTLQLKAAKDNVKHYSDLALERDKRVQQLAAEITKQSCDEALIVRDEHIERLTKERDELKEDLEYLHKLNNVIITENGRHAKQHPTDVEDKQKFATGAVRSSDAAGVRYDLITPVGLRRLAETYKEGSVKYGDNNWQKGFPASDVMNHAMRHIMLWLDGDKTEDHLAHAAWNLLTIMHFEERKPECIDVPTRKS